MTARRNILLISLDDAFAYWKYRSAFGAELQTPNLDRICAQSTAFENAYCQVPVCGPSRSSFMSGLTPHELGIFDNYTNVFDVLRPEQMWSYRLKQAGYFCSNGGKVHHGYKPLPDAIHNVLYSTPPERFNIGPGKNARVKEMGGMMRGQGTIDPSYDDRYYDAQSAASAETFFDSYAEDAPFFREVGFYHPHSPYKTPLRFKELYDPDAFVQPPDWADGYDRNAYADLFMRENMDNRDLGNWQRSVRNYFSAFSHVDAHLGRVWDALKASPHAENTIVVILADHGYHPGDKNRFRKFTLWEEAAGVPLIVHDPGDPVPRRVTDPVALLDVGPTVLDYADCPPLDGPGQSLRPQVGGTQVTGRAVPTFFFGSAAIRQGDHRYIRYQDGSTQLYDLSQDLWQLRDLSDREPALRDRLHAQLVETCRAYGLELDPQSGLPARYTVLGDRDALPKRWPSQGLFAAGSLPVEDASPGPRAHFASLSGEDRLIVPPGVRRVSLAADYRIGIDRFTIIGNDSGNLYDFRGGHNRFTLDITCGTGDDTLRGGLDRLDLTLTAGQNTVDTGNADAEIWGGRGHDVIRCGAGQYEITCGRGTSRIETAGARTRITTGGTHAEIHCTGEAAEITLARGMAEIEMTSGTLALTLRRTALPQRIRGFTEGQIDISDWATLGPVTLEDDGNAGVILAAGGERVWFLGTPRETVVAALIR